MSTANSTDGASAERAFGRVLALDTATRTQSLALLDGETVLEHSQRRVRFNHGSSLLVHIDQMFQEHHIVTADLDLVAVGVGPGSFTGLRVGLAIAKSLARAENVPLVGVSTLAALALETAQAHPQAAVCPMYDARRQEVYAGVYSFTDGALVQVDPDRTAAPAAMRERVLELAQSRPVVVLGDGPRKYDDLADWPGADVTVLPPRADAPSAAAIALLGREKARRGDVADVGALEPNYIRPTDAELSLK